MILLLKLFCTVIFLVEWPTNSSCWGEAAVFKSSQIPFVPILSNSCFKSDKRRTKPVRLNLSPPWWNQLPSNEFMTVIMLLILTMWSYAFNLESNGKKCTRKASWLILKHWQNKHFNKYTEICIINAPYSRECSSSARHGRTFNICEDVLSKTQVFNTALSSFHWSPFVRCFVYYSKPKVMLMHSSNHKKT